MSFEKWYHSVGYLGDDQNIRARISFEAGAQSKQGEVDKLQAEIDNLQNRIDDLKSFCIKGVESNMLSIEYNQVLIDMHKILKGEESK